MVVVFGWPVCVVVLLWVSCLCCSFLLCLGSSCVGDFVVFGVFLVALVLLLLGVDVPLLSRSEEHTSELQSH